MILKVNVPAGYYFYLLCFLIMVFTSCNGQKKSKVVDKVQSTENPLSLQEILKKDLDASVQIGDYFPDLLETKKGDYWFATAFKGVSRYDGQSLTTFTTADGLPHNTILDLTEDKDGNIWLATREGVSKYDGKAFQNFTKVDGLTSNWTSTIFADSKGSIWVGAKDGVTRFDGKSFSKFHLPKPVSLDYKSSPDLIIRIIEDRKGNMWFGRQGYGVCKYDGKTFSHLTKEDGLSSNSVKSILEDRQGNIWFGSLETELSYSEEGGLSRYDGSTITTFPEIESLTGHEVWDICEDKNGNIWIAPKNRGLVVYDGQNFTTVKGSMNNTEHSCVQSLIEDQDGQMWFGYSGGIFRLKADTSFVNVTKNGPWK